MRRIFKVAVFCLVTACMAPVFTSCSEDSNETVQNNADKKTINEELVTCKQLLASATEKDYPQTAIDAFKSVVTLVESALDKDPTQTAVDNMLTQLREAKATFIAAAFDALPLANLICSWDFDTEGTTLASTGTQKWNAVLKAGPSEIFGSDTNVPQFVDGIKGKALSFSKGAHLEVADYNTSTLLGSELAISVWVKPAKTVPGNYIMSLNYWNTFKFQLQEENKPFMTFASDKGSADCDNEMAQSVPNDKWSHLTVVLSYTTHTLKFYVNGELTKTWNASEKEALSGTKWKTDWTSATGEKLPLMIGGCTTYAEASSWEWFTPSPEAWDCFYGLMDQVKIFNVALTDGQVNKLYNDEK